MEADCLIEKFEQEFYQPGSDSKPHSMLRFLMEQQGLASADLSAALGSEVIVTETLTDDRERSIAPVKTLSTLFKVDPRVLI